MRRLSSDDFIKAAKETHGNKYDYSKVNYINASTPVEIICPKHGSFWQRPNDHRRGQGCKMCGNERISKNQTLSKDVFLRRAKEVHGNKYDYSKVNYINTQTKVEIICPKHGSFWQAPNIHCMQKQGCGKCRYDRVAEKRKKNQNTFIMEAKRVHNDRYNYEKILYKNTHTKVEIMCPKHGPFWQTPDKHLHGCGCPACAVSKGEDLIQVFLRDHNIKYSMQYKFSDCRDRKVLPFDFYLPDHNMCIEFDGIQHFKPIEYFGGEVALKAQKERDQIKNKYCANRGLNLIRISYTQINKIDRILSKILL